MDILVFGDSHTEIFEYCNTKQSFYNFNVCKVVGASAQGVLKGHSKTNAYNIYMKKIQNTTKNYDKILIMLGEVDCGFVVYLRSKKYNISIQEQIDNCIHNLFGMIKQILNKYPYYTNKDIIVCGVIIPTISDNADKKFMNLGRRQITESQFERTKLTIEYNNKLKNICQKNNYHYIEITPVIIDHENKILNKYFLRSNTSDHHLDNEKTYKLWINQLNNLFKV